MIGKTFSIFDNVCNPSDRNIFYDYRPMIEKNSSIIGNICKPNDQIAFFDYRPMIQKNILIIANVCNPYNKKCTLIAARGKGGSTTKKATKGY